MRIKVQIAYDQIVVIFFPGSGLYMSLHIDQPEDLTEMSDALSAVVGGRSTYSVRIADAPSLSVYRTGYEDEVALSIGRDDDFVSAYTRLSFDEAGQLERLLRAAVGRLEQQLEAKEQEKRLF
jgi:hypothetical protein